MITQYFAQPVMSTDQKLLGGEIMQDWIIHEKTYFIDVIYFITNGEAFLKEKNCYVPSVSIPVLY